MYWINNEEGMKIIYFIGQAVSYGGTEKVIIEKANYLVERGYDIYIVTINNEGKSFEEAFFSINKRIHTHDLGLTLPYSKNPFKHLCNRRRYYKSVDKAVRAYIEKVQPDIVISTFIPCMYTIPRIKGNFATILELHNSLWDSVYNDVSKFRSTYQQRKLLNCAKKYDRFVVLTNEAKEYLSLIKNVQVIYNPSPIQESKPAPLKAKQVLSVGRLSYQKNYVHLIDIWSNVIRDFPEWKLTIIGDGVEKESLQKKIQDMELTESIHIISPTKEIHQVYLDSSIFALTSNYEGLPLVLLEAQTIGLPTISYACKTGPRDIITNAIDGYLIDHYNKEQFADRLKKLMASEELRLQMGERARKASQRFQFSEIMPQWEKLFETLKKN